MERALVVGENYSTCVFSNCWDLRVHSLSSRSLSNCLQINTMDGVASSLTLVVTAVPTIAPLGNTRFFFFVCQLKVWNDQSLITFKQRFLSMHRWDGKRVSTWCKQKAHYLQDKIFAVMTVASSLCGCHHLSIPLDSMLQINSECVYFPYRLYKVVKTEPRRKFRPCGTKTTLVGFRRAQ